MENKALSHKVVIFDVETTGVDPLHDQIIELCVQYSPDPDAPQQTWRIKPQTPISPEAQSVHGITMEDLKECPDFASYEQTFRDIFESAEVLIGYNMEFDLKFIQSEFRRLKTAELDLRSKCLVDPYRIWRFMEPRTLTHAYQRFVGEEFCGAHAAAEDVRATGEVLNGMLQAFNMPKYDWERLSAISSLSFKAWIGPSSHFVWHKGVPVFGFGKFKNRPLTDVALEDNGSYLKWVANSDFPDHVKSIASSACSKTPGEFKDWLRENFGPEPASLWSE